MGGWNRVHLETADYDAEREVEDAERTEHDSDWEAPIAWNNFHHCTISSTEWHDGGFAVCRVGEFSLESLDGHVARVDPLPFGEDRELEDRAFFIYLLGHDSVAGHVIRFVRRGGGDRFDIHWEGKIALAYVGDHEHRYQFKARILDVAVPVIPDA